MDRRQLLISSLAVPAALAPQRLLAAGRERSLLYVASPGIRNYVEYGGVGVLVFDIDNGHRFVKRIPTFEESPGVAAENVKGICASAKTGRLYVSTIKRMACIDLLTDKLLWNRTYEGGCDRMAITPDGREIYLPSLEGPYWHVVNAATGDVVTRIVLNSGAHNTCCSLDGKRAYLAGLKSPYLAVVDTRTHEVAQKVGPFSAEIRPFTVSDSRCYVNVNNLLGFEVGDLKTGETLCRVEVAGYSQGPVKRHGCPSHGVGLTPDEKEVWVSDGHNEAVHVFDATKSVPRQKTSIKLREQPGWVTFSLDGRYAYPSTGEIIDVRTKKILTALADEAGRPVHSEKMIQVDFEGAKPVRNGDQFGLGRR
jgi:DNA-binding beta-propeller fold protein YncE